MAFGDEVESAACADVPRNAGEFIRSGTERETLHSLDTAGGGLCGMHVTAIGVDIVSIKKIADILGRHANAAASIFTRAEILYARSAPNEYERFAARFAAKEAVLKALGMGMAKGMSWHHIEVATVPSGRPLLRLSGAVSQRASHLGLENWLISLTHCREYAVAYVTATGSPGSEGPDSRPQQVTTAAARSWARDREVVR